MFNVALQKGWLDGFPDSALIGLSFFVALLFVFGIWHHPDVQKYLRWLYSRNPRMLLIGLIIIGGLLGGAAGALGYRAIRKQNANEAKARSNTESESSAQQSSTPSQSPSSEATTLGTPAKPSLKAPSSAVAPTPAIRHSEKVATSLPPSTATPAAPSPAEEPSYPVEKIRWSTEAVPSRRESFPFGLQVVIQTNVVISPTHIRIDCDGPVADGQFRFAGPISSMFNVMAGPSGNSFELHFGGPPFTPQTPLVVTLYSASKIKVLRVRHL